MFGDYDILTDGQRLCAVRCLSSGNDYRFSIFAVPYTGQYHPRLIPSIEGKSTMEQIKTALKTELDCASVEFVPRHNDKRIS